MSQFTDLFEKEYAPETDGSDSAEKRWQSLKTAMHSCALATFGKKIQSLLTGLRQNPRNSIKLSVTRGKNSASTTSTLVIKICASFGKPEKRQSRWSGVVPMITEWSLVNALKMLLLQALSEQCMMVLRPLQAPLRASLPP